MERIFRRLVAVSSAAAVLYIAVLLLGLPFSAQAGQGQEPDAEAVWNRLLREPYTDWELFPGTSREQAGNMPHGARVTIFANPRARQALANGTNPLPAGSIIIKENHMPDGTLAASTLMYKRPGYNPEHNDWYWLNRAADGTINAQGRVEGCQNCHGQAAARDYVMTEAP